MLQKSRYKGQQILIPTYSKFISYKDIGNRLFYEGLERKKEKEKELENQWKVKHPFRPSITSKRKSDDTEYHHKADIYSKTKQYHLAIRRHVQNNYDIETGHKLFTPQIYQYNADVIRKAYQARYNYELKEQAKIVDNRLVAVFRFFAFDRNTIKIQDLDLLYLKNECVILLRDILIKIIKSKNNLKYSDFVDVMLDNNLLPQVDKAYDFIQGKRIVSKSPIKIARGRSKSTTNYEQQIAKIVEKEIGKSTINVKSPDKSKSTRVTNTYSRFLKQPIINN